MTQLPNGIITMILDMVPRDSHYKHPVAVMLKASKQMEALLGGIML